MIRASPRRLPTALRRPGPWLVAFLAWVAAMWLLSSYAMPVRDGPEIPHIDKIVHFGWFFGGAGLLSAHLFLRHRVPVPPPGHALVVVAVLAVLGAIDEWHQSMVPGRSGNDPGDWAADVLGAVAGVLVFRRSSGILRLDDRAPVTQPCDSSR